MANSKSGALIAIITDTIKSIMLPIPQFIIYAVEEKKRVISFLTSAIKGELAFADFSLYSIFLAVFFVVIILIKLRLITVNVSADGIIAHRANNTKCKKLLFAILLPI